MNVAVNQEMVCQVSLRKQAASEHEGAFVDLKKSPERVLELPEARDWPAFGKFLADINRLADWRTSGSKAIGKTPGGHDAPFVDVAFCDPVVAQSENAQAVFRSAICELNDITSIAPDLTIELCASLGMYPDGEEAQATRIWLIGSRQQAELAFPVLLGFMAGQPAEMYRKIAEDEKSLN